MEQLRQRLPLPELMQQLGLGAHARKSAFCPFHENTHTPAFSVYADPRNRSRWKCHAGCGGGDELEFEGSAQAGVFTESSSKRERNISFAPPPLPAAPAAPIARGDAPQSPDERLLLLQSGSIPSTRLSEVALPPRARVVGDWFCEADLAFVFARRGLGKTWFSLALACAIASKRQIGPWPVHENLPVLYIDGEMPCETLRERIEGLGPSNALTVLNHEVLFHETGAVLNLTDPVSQAAVAQLCLQNGFKVLVLDNLSCLFSGVKENDADAWEAVLPWLLDLRRHRIAVLIVAHSGRDGKSMRGTSRREDAAFSVIRLDDPQETGEPRNRARFLLRFTKDRNSPMEQAVREWVFQTQPNGVVEISTKQADGMDMVLQWVGNGLTSCSEIAEEMGLSKGAVSKMATRLIELGRLKMNGRQYALP